MPVFPELNYFPKLGYTYPVQVIFYGPCAGSAGCKRGNGKQTGFYCTFFPVLQLNLYLIAQIRQTVLVYEE